MIENYQRRMNFGPLQLKKTNIGKEDFKEEDLKKDNNNNNNNNNKNNYRREIERFEKISDYINRFCCFLSLSTSILITMLRKKNLNLSLSNNKKYDKKFLKK